MGRKPCLRALFGPLRSPASSAALLVSCPMVPKSTDLIFPEPSLITPPKPTTPGFPFEALSKLSLKKPLGGVLQCSKLTEAIEMLPGAHGGLSNLRFQLLRMLHFEGKVGRFASPQSFKDIVSCRLSLMVFQMSEMVLPLSSKIHLFLSFQMLHTTIPGMRSQR